MKFIYVLISNETDFYAEEVLVSMLSLKKHNPEGCVSLVTDNATKNALAKRKSSILETASEIITVDIPEKYNKKCRSRFLKTSLPDYISDDFLYIDSDTVINGNLTDIEKYNYDVGAVYDRNEKGEFNLYMKLQLDKAGVSDYDKLVYYNGGVIFAKNTSRTKKFFKDWHRLWLDFYEKSGAEIDQISLLKANQLNGNIIQTLPGYYNCQIAFSSALKFLPKARIIHYIADYKEMAYFPLANTNILSNIRMNGITSEIQDIIDNPVETFLQDKFVISSRDKKLFDSNNVILGKELARYFPCTNHLSLFGLKTWAFLRLIRQKIGI